MSSDVEELDLNSIVQRDLSVISAVAGDDIVMVDIERGEYYGLSKVAREIWTAIEVPKRISDLIEDLVANYDIEPSSCEKDTVSFLEELLAERLVRVVNDAPC